MAGLGCDSGAVEVGAEEGRLWKRLGGTADLLRGFAGAEVQRGGVAAAAHELCAVDQRRGVAS